MKVYLTWDSVSFLSPTRLRVLTFWPFPLYFSYPVGAK